MNITIWSFMDRMGFEMFHYLLSVFWQSTLLFAAVLIVLFFLRNHRAGVRHKLWILALVLAPFLPLLTSAVSRIGAPQLSLPVLPAYRDLSPATSVNFHLAGEVFPEKTINTQSEFSSKRRFASSSRRFRSPESIFSGIK